MIAIKIHYYSYALLSLCISPIKSFVCLFHRYLLSAYYVPGITEVLVNVTDELSPPGVYLLVGAAM